ncbi:hypothetical protein J3R83DRAFT_2579 [Lanmaoa asiatica]|nr:hypothetical protein J3R83DRAFT_2579 [Lanmaoa asiatica]
MVGPDSSHGVSRVVHHKDFYLRGGDMTVLVENHLYRIHSYFFERESLFFRQKVNNSNNSNDEERGSTDNNAYTLEDVKSEDFARFLWVFYNPKYSIYDAPLDTWLSILKLANRWTFDNVKELSVRELEKIDIEAVEKISIYHENNISRLYLIPAYIAVCKRDKPLSFTEGMKLGMETVLRIAEARERLRLQASESGIRTPTFEDFEDAEVEVLIRDIFSLGSRPTSPSPVTSPSNGNNGSSSGVIKLGPAPSGNPPKANGASASRANGGSAADPRGSSVDSLPSIASVMSPQAPVTGTPATLTTVTQPTAPQEPQRPVPSAKPAHTASTSPPPPPPPASDKPKDNKEMSQEPSSIHSFLSPKTGGLLIRNSPQVDSTQGAGSHDVSITKPVVPPSAHSNDVTTESNDNMNDTEKDESGKDNDLASIVSDNDSGKGRGQGVKNKRGGKAGGAGRGNGNGRK